MQMFSRGILINSIIFVVRLPNLLSYLDCAIYLGQKLNYNKQFKNEFIGRIVEYTAMAGRIASASIKAVVGHKKSIKAALTLTPSAVEQLKKILSGKSDCIGLKIGVKQRGCNGLSYTLDYANEKHKLDEEVIQDGIRVFIDRKAQLTLLGTEMDFVQSKLSAEFIFYNPNIKGTCGCGESFNI